MKKVLFAAMVATMMAVALVGCDKNKGKAKVEGYDFGAVLKADKALVVKQYPDFTIKFYEANGLLATNLDKTVGTPVIVGMRTAWALTKEGLPPKPVTVTHAEGDYKAEPVVEALDGLWVEDQLVDIDYKVGAIEAAQKILKANIKKVPSSRVFVLRQPVWKTMPTEKYYIFGKMAAEGLVQVNSMTGEVKDCEF